MRASLRSRPLVLLGALALILGLASLSGCKKKRSAQGLLLTEIQIGEQRVQAELAMTPAEQARGLMYRRELGKNEGMLFVYPEEKIVSFWMKNTFIPLTIAFIDDGGTIVQLTDMAPQDLTSHRSKRPVRYALEMNQGWFQKAGVGVGDSAVFDVPAP